MSLKVGSSRSAEREARGTPFAAEPHMRRWLAVFVLLCGLAAPAEAVTLHDLVDLSKQGLSDDLLIALVEAEKSVFHLDAADVRSLKAQGLSDRLLIHLLQTPSLRPAPEPRLYIADAPAPAPERIVIIDRVETVAVPVYVPVPSHHGTRRDDRDDDSRSRRPSTVFWGYGGKQRPDSWAIPGKRTRR